MHADISAVAATFETVALQPPQRDFYLMSSDRSPDVSGQLVGRALATTADLFMARRKSAARPMLCDLSTNGRVCVVLGHYFIPVWRNPPDH